MGVCVVLVWCCFFLGSCACWAEVSGDLRASPRRPLALATALPAARRRGGEFCALRRAALSPSPPPGEAASSAEVGHVTSTLSLNYFNLLISLFILIRYPILSLVLFDSSTF